MESMPMNPTVFVVDDDLAARRSLGALVRSRGLTCREFTSAEDFLRECDLSVPGAVITDLRMGGMNGLELQQTLVNQGSLLSVIVVSGHADVPVTVKLMENGAVTLLQKPYQEHTLLEAIDRALSQNGQSRESSVRLREIGHRLAALSEDEERTLHLMMEGHANKAIARETETSLRTVDRRRRAVLDKMSVGTVAELVQLVTEYRHAASRLDRRGAQAPSS
jgi:FixJ family two-component response regulator